MTALPRVARTLREHEADPTLALASGFTRRQARFRPKRLDDLVPAWQPYIGRAAVWYCVGVADPDRYPGQNAWCAEEPDWPAHWMPDEDLEEVELKGSGS